MAGRCAVKLKLSSQPNHIEPVVADGSPLAEQLLKARSLSRSWIETRMIDALWGERNRLTGLGIQVRGQFRIGRWEADLFLQRPLLRGKPILVVECDGEEFHKPARDLVRDAAMRGMGYTVRRFTGKRIYHEAEQCAAEIVDWLVAQK